MPLCPPCHHGLHSSSGPFKRWTRAALRDWQDTQCTHYRALYRPSESDEWMNEDPLF